MPSARHARRSSLERVLASLPCALWLATAAAAQLDSASPAPDDADRGAPSTDACAVRSLRRSDVQGLAIESPDGRSMLVDRKDAGGVAQIYVSRDGAEPACISCAERPGAPTPARFKMQPHWHPSGRWITVAVERDSYTPPPLLGASREYVEGQLQNGLWTDLWAVAPDGSSWHRLTAFRSGERGVADGFTGPAFTPDGRRAVWSQIVDGNVFAYWPFGRWQLMLADWEETADGPRRARARDITPAGMHWNEPGNFHPDGRHVLLSGSTAKDAEGMDQYVLDVETGTLANLTDSPTTWDEHGIYSPDGRKILFMSAYPYRDDPKASKILSIRTEFMVMDADGSHVAALTHFKAPGHPETSEGIAANAEWRRDGRSARLLQLVFPDYVYWDIEFAGACGANR